jgi:ABC-type transporter Mla maintaining outer membrane lipid asymmetry ATPase subunit MlaF
LATETAHEPTVPQRTDAIIRFDDVVKRFGDKTVLDGMNFSVAPGERVTLIGPSGSGKTTILRLLMTLEDITDGVIWVNGEPLTHERKGDKLVPASEKYLRSARRQIGMVFQQFNLFPSAAEGRDRPRPGDGARHPAARRGDLRARPRAGRRRAQRAA